MRLCQEGGCASFNTSSPGPHTGPVTWGGGWHESSPSRILPCVPCLLVQVLTSSSGAAVVGAVQTLSHVRLCRIIASQAPLSSTISQSLLKFMLIELVMLTNHLMLCHPLLLFPSIFPSVRVFSLKLAIIRWPMYWSFSQQSFQWIFRVDFL